jgi:hypothetical protein
MNLPYAIKFLGAPIICQSSTNLPYAVHGFGFDFNHERQSMVKTHLSPSDRSVDALEPTQSRLLAHGPWGRFGRDALSAQEASELPAPFAEHPLTDIHPLQVRGHHGSHDNVNMRMWLVGMERKGVAMPVGKFLLDKVPLRCQ